MPGKRARPLGRIDLPVCFGTPSNYLKEILTFEVVGFKGTYHAILGRPCYTKFMAIPNYTYLKLKMSGPNGVITIDSTFSHAYTCDREHYELATAVINSAELPELGNSATPTVPDCNGLTSSSAFRPLEETKVIGIDYTNPTKTVRIGTQLPAK